MKKPIFTSALVIAAGISVAQTAAFTPGNLVVSQVVVAPSVGGGMSSVSGAVNLVQYSLTPSDPASFTLNLPTAGVDRFTQSNSAASALNLQFNGGFFTLAGLDFPVNNGGSSATMAAANNRVIAQVPMMGATSYVRVNDAYSGDIFRSAVTDGAGNFWMAGNGTPAGIRFSTGGSSVGITTGTGTGQINNVRVVSIFNGELWFSSGSGLALGINKVPVTPVGLPFVPTAFTRVIAAPASSSPYDFAIANPNLIYVADDSTATASLGGLQKWAFDGASWVREYVTKHGGPEFPAVGGIRAVTLVSAGADGTNVLAVVTAAATPSVWLITDSPTGTDTAVKLQDSPTGTLFRGIRYVPGSVSTPTIAGTATFTNHVADYSFETITIEFYDSGNNLVASLTDVADTAGAFSAGLTVAPGTYTVKVKGDTTLRKAFTGVVVGTSNINLGTFGLLNGNANGDTEVGPADFSTVLTNFGNEGGPNDTGDLDGNGEVGPADFSAVLANFGGEDE